MVCGLSSWSSWDGGPPACTSRPAAPQHLFSCPASVVGFCRCRPRPRCFGLDQEWAPEVYLLKALSQWVAAQGGGGPCWRQGLVRSLGCGLGGVSGPRSFLFLSASCCLEVNGLDHQSRLHSTLCHHRPKAVGPRGCGLKAQSLRGKVLFSGLCHVCDVDGS